MHLLQLEPSDAAIYRELRLEALSEWPPAFGSVAAEEAKKPLEEIAAYLRGSSDRKLFGAFVDSVLVGIVRYSRYSGSNEGHRAYVASLYVEPGARGQGLGRALVSRAIEEAVADESIRRINLSVVSTQARAIHLYESLGFTACGIDYEAFSARGEYFDELLMTKPIRASQPPKAAPLTL